MREITAILLCAGESRRMGFHKLLHKLPNGHTPMYMSLLALIEGGATRVVIVVNDTTYAHANDLLATAGIPVVVCKGGETRQQSVYLGLKHASNGIVVIHDAARCLTRPRLVQSCIDSAKLYGSGVAAIPVRDTVLHVKNIDKVTPVPREELILTQTPQAFDYDTLVAAYEKAKNENMPATDDSTLYAAAGNPVRFVRGHQNNRKLTTQDDIVWLEEHLYSVTAGLKTVQGLRIGFGEDVHRLVENKRLILCGTSIPYEKGLLGHSDADVATHALIDALLGAAGLDDIGRHFPDTDEKYKDISSLILLEKTVQSLSAAGYGIRNADITIIAQKPRLVEFFPLMRDTISKALNIKPGYISIKATTTEGVGPEGRGECIRANAVALLYRQ